MVNLVRMVVIEDLVTLMDKVRMPPAACVTRPATSTSPPYTHSLGGCQWIRTMVRTRIKTGTRTSNVPVLTTDLSSDWHLLALVVRGVWAAVE